MAAQLLVDCLEYHTHAALPQPADEFVMTKDGTWRQFLHSPILPVSAEPGKKSWELKRNPPRAAVTLTGLIDDVLRGLAAIGKSGSLVVSL